MTKDIPRCAVTDTLIKSTISAYREYIRICDFTMGVYETPEYWYTTAITRALAKKHTAKNIYPVLEDSMSSVSSYGKKSGKGRFPDALRKDGRTDIALWRYNDKSTQDDWEPISVIEVKRGWRWGGKEFKSDIDRILTSLNKFGKKTKTGTLKHGFFVIISDDWDLSDTREKSRNDMVTKFKENYQHIQSKIEIIVTKHNERYNYKDRKFKAYIDYSEYNMEHGTMGAAMVFKFR